MKAYLALLLLCGPAVPAAAQTTATPPPDWVAARVDAARARLQATPAGRLVWAAMDAQGGLARWYGNGPIGFRFDYRPTGDRPGHDTYEIADTWSARTRHTLADPPGVEFGWSGAQAWVHPADADPGVNVRFWSLTPYYFVGLPFVLADPGVQLSMDPPASLEGRPCDVVRATFGTGTGDSPGDYYVLYLDASSHRLRGIRYVVAYPGFFPPGQHSPEKLMTYDGDQTVSGIALPTAYRTFAWSDGQAGELVTETTLSEVQFLPDTPATAFDVPPDARVIEGY
jgi:hypothetical protein